MFIKKSVYDNPLSLSYFNINILNSYTDKDGNNMYDYTGKCVGLTYTGEKTLLKGKITIPTSIIHNGEALPVVTIKGFRNCNYMTHCFFEQNENGVQVKEFLSNCFEGCSNLRYIELPQSLRIIDYRAFYGCYNLAMTDASPYDLIIGGNVYSIGQEAFSIGSDAYGSSQKSTNIYIGSSVKSIGIMAFAFIDRQVNNIYLGSVGMPT